MTTMQSAVAAELLGGKVTASRFENSGSQIAQQRPDLMARVSNAQGRVLEFLLAGLTEPQIAEKIGRSRHTVHDHTKAIYSSLNVNNRVQLVLLFSQNTTQPVPAAPMPAPIAQPFLAPATPPALAAVASAPVNPNRATPLIPSTAPISDVVFTQARPIGPAKNLAVA
jgi:DNA-binding CsgD family transcriptional regulator